MKYNVPRTFLESKRKPYPTIAQEAHRLCKRCFGKGIKAVLEDECLDINLLNNLEYEEQDGSVSHARQVACLRAWGEFLSVPHSPLSQRAYGMALASGGVSVFGTNIEEAA